MGKFAKLAACPLTAGKASREDRPPRTIRGEEQVEAYRIDRFASVDGIVLRSNEDPRPGLREILMFQAFSLISAISARAAGSPLSGAAAAVLSSATAPAWSRPCPRAFCRTKSSGCLSASTAPASPPLLIRARQRRCPGRHLYPTSRDVALRRADVFLGGQSYRGKFGLGLRQHGPQRDGEGRTGRSR
jgi:hypothetical protein